MKIYTLFYKDTGLYNRSIFVLPNDAAARKAMKLNLMNSQAEQFRNEVRLGNVELKSLCDFDEEHGIHNNEDISETVCNLKELLDDDSENPAPVQ